MFKNRTHKKSGFTLVELLIVIVVLGVLVSIVIPMFGDSTDKAKSATALATLETLRKQLNLAKVEHDGYFPDLVRGGLGWDALLIETRPTSTSSGTYDTGTTGAADNVGPYIYSRPINPFEDSDTVADFGGAGRGVGFVYNQENGAIKTVIPFDKFEDLDLSTDHFETYT